MYHSIAFQAQGCCFGNQVTIIEQSPPNNYTFTLLPPCVARYLSINCPNVSLSASYCTTGMNSDTTISQGMITFNKVPVGSAAYKTPPGLPSVYSEQSILVLQGVISTALLSTYNSANYPYKQILLPLNIEISNYMYYNGTTPLTPSDGIAYTNKSDYLDANRAVFYFNVVTVYGNVTKMNYNTQFLSSPYFMGAITTAYGLTPNPVSPPIITSATGVGINYESDTFNTAHNTAYINSYSGTVYVIVLLFVILISY